MILGLILFFSGIFAAWGLLADKGDTEMAYDGNSECTIFGVRRYIKENYQHEDGTPLSDAEVVAAVEANRNELEVGCRLRSFDYFVGDQIVRAWAQPWVLDEDGLDEDEHSALEEQLRSEYSEV